MTKTLRADPTHTALVAAEILATLADELERCDRTLITAHELRELARRYRMPRGVAS